MTPPPCWAPFKVLSVYFSNYKEFRFENPGKGQKFQNTHGVVSTRRQAPPGSTTQKVRLTPAPPYLWESGNGEHRIKTS